MQKLCKLLSTFLLHLWCGGALLSVAPAHLSWSQARLGALAGISGEGTSITPGRVGMSRSRFSGFPSWDSWQREGWED